MLSAFIITINSSEKRLVVFSVYFVNRFHTVNPFSEGIFLFWEGSTFTTTKKGVGAMKESDTGVKWFNTVFFPQRKTARPARYEDGVLPRLREKDITFFTPWGPRYDWESRGVEIREDDKEVQTLKFLAELLGEMRQNMPNNTFRWLFLGADLYGWQINNLPYEMVNKYFDSFESWLHQILPMADFRLWSRFERALCCYSPEPYHSGPHHRPVNADRVRRDVRENINWFVGQQIRDRAAQTALRMGRGSSPEAYLVERIAEALLIEQYLKPIKISCVARHKDDSVDVDLPRLYFLPERLHAPWL